MICHQFLFRKINSANWTKCLIHYSTSDSCATFRQVQLLFSYSMAQLWIYNYRVVKIVHRWILESFEPNCVHLRYSAYIWIQSGLKHPTKQLTNFIHKIQQQVLIHLLMVEIQNLILELIGWNCCSEIYCITLCRNCGEIAKTSLCNCAVIGTPL